MLTTQEDGVCKRSQRRNPSQPEGVGPGSPDPVYVLYLVPTGLEQEPASRLGPTCTFRWESKGSISTPKTARTACAKPSTGTWYTCKLT